MDWIVGDGLTPAGLIRIPDDIPSSRPRGSSL